MRAAACVGVVGQHPEADDETVTVAAMKTGR